MKYSLNIDIDLPRDKVIALFDSTENLSKWQKGLVSFENIDGEPGQVDAKSLIKYKMNKREVDMVETITKRNFPNEFWAIYEAKGVWNEVRNSFEEVSPTQTRWTTDHEFKISGFLKIMAVLMPGAFKKQSYKYMKDFKRFAEGN